jgi:TonB family protein
METQQGHGERSSAKSFLQAKWFPGTIASLALIISLGGHAFTAINTVGFAKLSNEYGQIEENKVDIERVISRQERFKQATQTQLVKQARVIQSLQAELVSLRAKIDEAKEEQVVKASVKGAGDEQTSGNLNAHVGVNPRFDALILGRLKANYESPAGKRLGSEDQVVIAVAVDRKGWVTDAQIATSSGQIGYDNAVIKAALRMDTIPEIGRLNDTAYAQVKSFRLSVNSQDMM